MKLKLARHAGISLAIARSLAGSEVTDLRKPRIGRAIGDKLHACVNCHRIERIVLERDCLIGFGHGCIAIVVCEREIGHQFVRLCELRVEPDGFC